MMEIAKIFQSGGPFMYPILIVFALGLAITIERFLYLLRTHSMTQKIWAQLAPMLKAEDYERAHQLFDEASGHIGDNHLAHGNLLRVYSQILRDEDRIEEAKKTLDEAASILLPITSAQRRAHIIRHQADIAAEMGLLSESFVHYEAALSIYRRDSLTNPMDLANTLRGFALLKERWKEVQEAKKMWREAKEIYSSFGIEEGVKECNAHLYP